MTLKTAVPDLLREFPELKAPCDKEFYYYGDEVPDAYPVFSTILRPAAFAAIDRQDEVAIRRFLDFYERVAADPDDDVNALTHIELIEQLANDPRRLQLAWPYMGEHTREQARVYARESKRQFGKEVWLPE